MIEAISINGSRSHPSPHRGAAFQDDDREAGGCHLKCNAEPGNSSANHNDIGVLHCNFSFSTDGKIEELL
jgi:hypothetical protein